jgi:hypothetical protein
MKERWWQLVSERMTLIGQHSAVAVVPVQTHDTMKWVMVISGSAISDTVPVPADPVTQTPRFSPYPCYFLNVMFLMPQLIVPIMKPLLI